MATVIVSPSDIKHRHISRFGATELQAYCDQANAKFVDYSAMIGVSEADISSTPTSSVVQFVLADMYMDIARDNIGSEGSIMVSDGNLYSSIYAQANDQYIKLKPRMTANMITGSASSNETSAVSFGKIVRG